MINTWVWRLTLWWSWYRVSFWNYCLMVFNRLDINWNYSSQTVANLVWAIECIFEIIISQGIVVQGVKCFLSKINEKINIFTDFFLGNPLPKYNYLHRDLRYCLPSLKKRLGSGLSWTKSRNLICCSRGLGTWKDKLLLQIMENRNSGWNIILLSF